MKEKSVRSGLLSSLLFAIIITLPCYVYSQKQISGTVLNEKNEPLQGATVKSLSTGKSVISDRLGKFVIPSPKDTLTLNFSHVGYVSATILVSKTNQEVKLAPMPNDLDEVVVVGYGTTTRRDMTGSVSKAPMEDMKKAPVGSFVESIQGRVAGVTVNSSDGQPGTTPTILIRGSNSITQDNSPLYVIDGFPVENPDPGMLNPNDIESMDILKDASATAVYGARGANGVIIITTKSAKAGTPKVTLNFYEGTQSVLKKMAVLSPYDFVNLMIERDSLSNTTTTYLINGVSTLVNRSKNLYLSNGTTLDQYKTAQGTNFQDLLFRPSFYNNYDLSISGGDQKTKVLFSGNYFDQNGIIINSGYKRFQGRLNLDQILSDNLKWGIRANYSYESVNGQASNAGSANTPSTMSLFASVWAARPITALNSTGVQSDDLSDDSYDPLVSTVGTSDYRMNPIVNQENTYNKVYRNNLVFDAFLDWQILKHLKLRMTGGLINRDAENDIFYNSKTIRGNVFYSAYGAAGPNGSVTTVKTKNYSNDNILTYNNTFAKKHTLDITAVYSLQQNVASSFGARSIQNPNESLTISGLDEGTPSSITSTSSNWTLQSFTGRVNYNYDRRYFLTGTIRADGSSKFASGNRWGSFPSAAVKWSIINEKFMRSLQNTFTDLSIRSSYGKTGNNRISDFGYLSLISNSTSSAYPFMDVITNGATLTGLSNPFLKWETTGQWDLGLDVSAFKNRIGLSVEVYKKKTDNLLLQATLPGSTGYLSALKNVGSMQNTGLEISLNTLNVSHGKFSWSTTFNISFTANKVLSLADGQQSLASIVPFDANYASSNMYMSRIGSPIGLMYGLKWDGNYQYSDFDNITATNPTAANAGTGSHYVLKSDRPTNGPATTRTSIQPGDIKYKDLNGDGIITTDDYTVIGRGLPKHYGGFGNTFNYGSLSLNIFFQWSYGNNLVNANRLMFEGNPNNYSFYNQFATENNRWTPTNQTNALPRSYGNGSVYALSTRVIENGSYLRLKTVNLSYGISQKFTKKIRVREIKVYASAQNLFTITKYTGPDPEVNITGSVLTPGFDYSPYPRARTLVGGLTVNF